MLERRREAASLVSLLVVTLLFVWACSSHNHEDASVTTSGGAGSAISTESGTASLGDAGTEFGFGGTKGSGSPLSMDDGGASDGNSTPPDFGPSAGGQSESSGGAGIAGSPPQITGGIGGVLGAGGSSAEPNAGGPSRESDAGGPSRESDAGGPSRESNAGGPSRESNAGAPSVGGAAAGGAPAVSEPVCDPADDHSTPAMFLPCEVSTALYVCRRCHSNPPASGVFSSYVTFADIKPHAAQIYGVITSGTMPWPPYTLSTWQKSTALKWLGKNGSCAIGAAKPCQ